jgi:acetyl/propionyl-CoA carboxylase alpha subunit
MFKRVLIANRGEVANRIISTCLDLGIETVAIYSDDDRSLHYLNRADHAYRVGAGAVSSSYKNQDAVMAIAKMAQTDCLHPGNGFLAEETSFAKLCKDNKVEFIGGNETMLKNLSNKLYVRSIAKKADIKTVDCGEKAFTDVADAKKTADKFGYPVFVKPVCGMHTRGVRRIDGEKNFEKGFLATQIEGSVLLNDNTVLVEKALLDARHIEVPVLRDKVGRVLCLPELDCSIQRRYHKIVAETPAPNLDDKLRKEIKASATKLANELNVEGLASFEFLVKDGVAYFLEVNPRLTVEHSVTELVTGLDLVKQQFLIAAGKPLELYGREFNARGSAIQCRIYAEDPETYEPYMGVVNDVFIPMGPNVRHELIAHSGWHIPIHYDNMLAKMSVWDNDRKTIVNKMTHLLKDYFYSGIITNITLMRQIFETKEMLEGTYNVDFMRDDFVFKKAQVPQNFKTALAIASAIRAYKNEETVRGELDLKGESISSWQKELGTGRL